MLVLVFIIQESKLHVNGDIKVTGTNAGISFRDGAYNGRNQNCSIYSDGDGPDRLNYNGYAGHVFRIDAAANGSVMEALRIERAHTENNDVLLNIGNTFRIQQIHHTYGYTELMNNMYFDWDAGQWKNIVAGPSSMIRLYGGGPTRSFIIYKILY